MNYHGNKDGRGQILHKWLGASRTPRLGDTARDESRLSWSEAAPAAVGWMESAWYYRRGNGGLEAGGGIVGIQTCTLPLAPPFFLLRRSSLLPQSIYMLSATGKSRLNNSLRLGMMSSLSRLIWPQNTHETQCVFRVFFFPFSYSVCRK